MSFKKKLLASHPPPYSLFFYHGSCKKWWHLEQSLRLMWWDRVSRPILCCSPLDYDVRATWTLIKSLYFFFFFGVFVHSSPVCNSPKLETTHIPINRERDKQPTVYLWKTMQQQKWVDNMDECQNHHLKQNEPDQKKNICYNPLYFSSTVTSWPIPQMELLIILPIALKVMRSFLKKKWSL